MTTSGSPFPHSSTRSGRPGRQMPHSEKEPGSRRGQLPAPGCAGWKGPELRGTQGGMGSKASALPICPLLSSHVPDPPAQGLGGCRAEPTLEQAAMCSVQAWLHPCCPEPLPQRLFRTSFPSPFLIIGCYPHSPPLPHPGPNSYPSALGATPIPEWVASWGDMSRAACQPPFLPGADDAARCTRRW